MSQNVIEIENLSVKFGDHLALEEINLQIPQSSFTAIVGPNGAGKSTFFKVLLGLVKPASGKAVIFNYSPQQVPPDWIGYVPQVKTIDLRFPALAIELVLTGILLRWPWRQYKPDRERAIVALEQVGAAHLAERPLSKLSGGELQRVCIARSIVRQPKLVMLDEPATGIDAVGEADMYRMLEAYQKKSGATLLMITHDWHAATHHADRVLLLNRKQVSFGPPKIAMDEKSLRSAFGHIGHEHKLDFLVNSDD